MLRKNFWFWVVSVFIILLPLSAMAETGQLKNEFAKPGTENRPWVYWFWNNGNITAEGIKADLEAMANVGIGGVLIMEVGQGAPVGPVDFLSEKWRELFKYMITEANRLGIEVNMNNDAGWNGSGGKWITPEYGMQVLTWSETNFTEPKPEKITLPTPSKRDNYYKDIAVFAFPTPNDNAAKKAVNPDNNRRSTPDQQAVVAQKDVIDLTGKMAEDGSLDWNVPAGNWTILRIGHTSKGKVVHPAPTNGTGLECDKLSVKASEEAFNGQMGKLISDNKNLAGTGKTLMATHIDSWENGSQNWTPQMRDEFQNRRKYDLWKFLPVFVGYIIDSTEITDRFLWDFRRTVSETCLDNYVGTFKRLANQHGLKLSIEAYGSPCDYLQYGGIADEPMGEFWIGGGAINSCRGMASSGHLYGQKIIGAEAFTADNSERWKEHPGSIKVLGDLAFSEGINRFVFHRYSFQPWHDVKPGLMMGPWGVHYERTQTWWNLTPAWHEYLARCQFLLRQGDFVADIVYVETEDSPQSFSGHPRNGYQWDQCGADAVYKMSVQNGKLMLPSGANYEILVLPRSDRMTPELLKKIIELVKNGATVIGHRPRVALGLTNYPENDTQIQKLADELWGDNTETVGERSFGNGKIVWGKLPEVVLAEKGIRPDFIANRRLNQIHRRSADADFYFVANPNEKNILAQIICRAVGNPELWYPESGKIVTAPVYRTEHNETSLLLPLEPTQSVFIVFSRQNHQDKNDPVVALSHNGTVIADLTFPVTTIEIEQAAYGVPDDPNATRDATAAVQKLVADGLREIPVAKITQAVGDPKFGVVKTLRIDFKAGGTTYSVSATDGETAFLNGNVPKIKILKAKYGLPNDETKTIDVRDLLQKILDAGENDFSVARLARKFDPAPMIVKTLNFDYELNGKTETWSGTDGTMIRFEDNRNIESLRFKINAADKKSGLVFRNNGRYELRTASGKKIEKNVALREPLEIGGEWSVDFQNGKTTKEITFEKLISWSDSPDETIRYFSGTAIYRKTLNLPKDFLAAGQRVELDLGNVHELAEVFVNGKPLGVLWTREKSMDVTELLNFGNENSLEIRVTNLWCNRLIGDELLPPNSDRNPNGTLKSFPQWLLDGKPDPSGRQTFCMWNLWKKEDTLLPSGLLGPVRLVPIE